MIEVRARLSEGVNRARLRLEARRAARPLLVLAIGALVGIAGAVYLVSHVSNTLFRSTYEVRFAVADATGIVPGTQDVRFRGILAGDIAKIDRRGRQVFITAKIRKEYGPIYNDVRAQLRPDTPLQDMFLDIVDPGTPKAGKVRAGSIVPADQTDVSVNVDDVLNVLQANERTRIRQLLGNLGNGLDDRGQALRATFVRLAPLLQVAGRITGQIAKRSRSTKRLVHNAGILTEELGRRDTQLRTLVREGSATFGTLQSGSKDLDATLRELPPTFAEIRGSLAAVQGILGDVDGAVSDLYPVADELPQSLASLRKLSATLAPAVRRLQGPVQRLVPLSKSLVPVTADLSATAAALKPQVPPIDRTTEDLVRCEKAVIGFFQWNTSLTKFGDLRGPIPRGNLAIGVPDSGVGGVGGNRIPGKNCVVGAPTIGGRPARPEDHH